MSSEGDSATAKSKSGPLMRLSRPRDRMFSQRGARKATTFGFDVSRLFLDPLWFNHCEYFPVFLISEVFLLPALPIFFRFIF